MRCLHKKTGGGEVPAGGFNPCCIGMTLWGLYLSSGWYRVIGFNPCCIGMTLWGPITRDNGRRERYVSILVVLEWPYEEALCKLWMIKFIGFQSLLYWNDLMRSHRHGHPLVARCVSILVVLEWPYEAQCRSCYSLRTFLFQSLLYWNDLMRRSNSRLVIFKPFCGFNPCCIGMTLWGFLCDLDVAKVTRFNPCCIGMTLWGIGFGMWCDTTFGFNPCCIGMTLWGVFRQHELIVLHHVSILVVLEWPYEVDFLN